MYRRPHHEIGEICRLGGVSVRSQQQGTSGHRRRLRQAHDLQERGRNIAQRAVLHQRRRRTSHIDQWDWIQRVRSVCAACFRNEHLIAVTMVGGNDGSSPDFITGGEDIAHAAINSLAGCNGSLLGTGVADHVRVGEIDDNQPILA